MKIILAFVLSLFATAALAQECGPRDQILQLLGGKYGETRQAIALGEQGASIFEFYANEETGTWTVVVTFANGQTCVPASGVDWQREHGKPNV